MSSKLTDRQQQVLDCIRECIADTGMAPTRAEIADIMGFQSKNAASDHLRALERKGFIKLHSDRSRGIQLLDNAFWSEEELPVVGKVAAGVPIEAIENVERTVPVPQGLFKQRPTYLLKVQGDSMIEAGIFDGDFALVKRTESARDGEIVVALVDNEEATLKYLRKDGGRVILDPANGAYDPQVYEAHRVQVQGKLAGLLRRYH